MMGLLHKATTSAGLGNPSLAAETVVYTTPAVMAGQGVSLVNISGTVNITPGVAATGITIRVRQGSLAGPVVGVSLGSHTVVAGSPQNISFGATDATPYLESANVYVVTAQQTAATGNGTTNGIDVEVLV